MRLLLVEDEPSAAAVIAKLLREESYAVDIASNGTDGLWMARENDYDAIVLDLMLPGMNGFQVCRCLREAEVWTPILVLTAKDGELDEAEALDTGADDYLAKPFSYHVLVARLRALARRTSTRAVAPVEVGDLRVDGAARRAWRGDEELALTAREFDVLERLVRTAGAVQSKQDLLAAVWDDDFEGDPNIVEVYIARLRRKVDEPFGRRSIETLRGSGYRLVDDAR